MFEFIRRYLSKSFKPCYFRIWSKRCNSFCFFIRRIAISCFFFISYPEERCLKNINMSFSDQIGKELKEKCKQKQPDMHSVNISISCNNNIIISQVFNSVFNIECSLKKVKLLILINNLLCKTKRVKWFATEAEDSLCLNISRFGYRAAC